MSFRLCFSQFPDLVFCGPAVPSSRPIKSLKYSKLGDIEVPEVQQVTLANGMRLFLLEDHELPLVNVSVRIRAGSAYEPADKIGLASITG